MTIGIAMICLDHLNKDNTTYLTVGVAMTSSLVAYWLPEPGSPGRKKKKCHASDCPQNRSLSKPSRNKKRSRSEPANSDTIARKPSNRTGMTTVDLENQVKPGRCRGQCTIKSILCCCWICYCLRNMPAAVSKKNGKFLIFLIRAILSFIGMFAGIVLIVLDQINDGDGPYLTVGIAMLTSIIGYWLPSPKRPTLSRKGPKRIPRAELRQATKQANLLKKKRRKIGRNRNK